MKTTRTERRDVMAIKTYALVITAQKGQSFMETPKLWELWDSCHGRELCVRRILKRNVLSVETKLGKAPVFVIGQSVHLTQVGNLTNKPMLGIITGKNPAGMIISVEIKRPKQWLFQLLRARGIFTAGPQTLQLFFDHTGNWTDIFGFNHFKIL